MTSSRTNLVSLSDAYKTASDSRPESLEVLCNFRRQQRGENPCIWVGSPWIPTGPLTLVKSLQSIPDTALTKLQKCDSATFLEFNLPLTFSLTPIHNPAASIARHSLRKGRVGRSPNGGRKTQLEHGLTDLFDVEVRTDTSVGVEELDCHTSVHLRKAVLGFLAQLDINELPLFFALLLKPLLSISERFDGISKWFLSSSEWSKDEFDSFGLLKYFTMDNILAISWKKRYGFLHVIENILGVFDEFHVKPYLDLLMGCVVRILGSCTSILESGKSTGLAAVETDSSFKLSVHEKGGGAENQITTSIAMKQFKELRSLCLKIISLVLNKYEDHEFGCEFWDLFFASVKPLIDGFKQEGASSEKPSSLFSCFLAMSRSYKLVSLFCREKNLVPDIFSILSVTTASEAILSSVLKFVENLLNLDSELDHEDNAIETVLLSNLDALICSLHGLFKFNSAARRYDLCP
ncbi:hypothetical protein TEA_014813 [Camellia sinensis var. sinensis]|uniref:U3 small nucleolar RNA-associated protein 20 N-terminal domain-containing protein n=1 Tax=Camellia sinensis var. sinensis TaxID=542762 RepID=A0A4S4EHX5_CAMSN|nr:hypothetical protein TEA_014813 [Camellia sinensis var. sinensis]